MKALCYRWNGVPASRVQGCCEEGERVRKKVPLRVRRSLTAPQWGDPSYWAATGNHDHRRERRHGGERHGWPPPDLLLPPLPHRSPLDPFKKEEGRTHE